MKKSLTLLFSFFLVLTLQAQQGYLVEVTQISPDGETTFTDEVNDLSDIEDLLEQYFINQDKEALENAFMWGRHHRYSKVYQSYLANTDDDQALYPARRLRPGDWLLEEWMEDSDSESILFSNKTASENPLMRTRERGFLGVTMRNIDRAGISVLEVIDGSEAERIGIQPNDIIVNINGESIQNSNQFHKEIKKYEPGTTVSLGLIRFGQDSRLKATLTSYEEYMDQKAQARKAREEKERAEWLRNQRAHLGVFVDDTGQGVEVTGVKRNSPAEAAGLASGDIIMRIDDQSTLNTDRLQDIIQSYRVGDVVKVYYRRDGVATFAEATLGTNARRSYGCHSNRSLKPAVSQNVTTVKVTKPSSSQRRTTPSSTTLEVIQFRAFPNPSQGMIQVEVQVERGALATLNIVDQQGRQVRSLFINQATQANTFSFDLSNEPAGLYQIQLIQGDKQTTRQVVVGR